MTDPPAETAPGGRHADVLAVLRAAERPLSAAEVAASCGLHVNTARLHLDSLAADGLAERATEPRGVPGRPRILYSPTAVPGGARSYRLLSEMLVGLVASLADAPSAAAEVGRAWGRHLVERSAPSERVDPQEAMARLTRLLDGMGFQPEVGPRRNDGDAGRGSEVRLHHCPFREVAEGHTDIVCAIHLGVMQGAMAEQHVPLEVTSLHPFVTPRLCVAQLRDAEGAVEG
jgi:predicted ArsR family transcriptional regulator